MQSKSKQKQTPLITLIQTNRIFLKRITPSQNQSIASTKLGMTKSHNQIIATFEFSKMKLL
jgi:hypothetical protein